jgi:hypothetical protein
LRTGFGYIDFSEQLGHGYFNPDQYLTIYESAELTGSFGERVSATLNGRFGFEREDSSDWFTAASIGGSLSLRASSSMSLTAGYANSKSRLDTQSGYQADGFYFLASFALRK